MADGTDGKIRRAATPPGPSGLPFLGSLLDYRRDPYGFVTRLAREYGDVVHYTALGTDFYQLNSPEAIEHVLVHENENYVKGELFQQSLGPVTGNGILNSEGEEWRANRHRIEPAFHPDRIEEYATAMVAWTGRTLEDWSDGAVVDVHGELMGLTLRIVADALLGADVERDVETVGEALDTVLTFQEGTVGGFLPFELPTPGRRRFESAVADLDRVVYRIIDERRRQLDEAGVLDADDDSDAPADLEALRGAAPDDVVSWLLVAEDESGDTMSRRQVRDEVTTLLLAGHETTALALTFTCYALARHPSVEERLVEEVTGVLDGRDPSVADLADMPYLERVLTESMRLYPPVPGIIREPVADDVVAGYRIPAGSTVTMNQWTVHRDPAFYDDPLAFRPERWTEEFRESLPHLAYFPFSAGPRRCIGDRFARMEAKLVLATVLSEFHLELVSPDALDLLATITARPTHPVEMRLHRRN